VEVAGVAEGASVVVAGQASLKDGIAVTVREQVPA
jgi:Fe2+ transport system protein FeoA